MTDEQQPQAGTTDAVQEAAAQTAAITNTAQDAEDVNALPQWAQRIIADLRKESASHRKAKAEAEKAAHAAAEQAAKEQGKWRELYEGAEPKAKRADELEAFVAEMLEAEVADVPEKLRKLVPAGNPLDTLRWVREAKAAGILARPNAPQTDARDTNGTRQGAYTGGLSAQEFAAIYGVKPEYVNK